MSDNLIFYLLYRFVNQNDLSLIILLICSYNFIEYSIISFNFVINKMRNLKDNESNMNKNNSLNQFYLKSDYKTISRDNIHLICSNNQEITLPQGDIDLIFPFLKKIISNSQSKVNFVLL